MFRVRYELISPTPPLVLSYFVVSPPPPGLWLKCNRILKSGRPVGAVTFSRWEWCWNERWIWGASGALNLISTNYPDHGHHGRLPLSRKNTHGRAGNRTRNLMVSGQEFWPPSHEAGRIFRYYLHKFQASEVCVIFELSLCYCALDNCQRRKLHIYEQWDLVPGYYLSSVLKGLVTSYGLDGPGIESQWWLDFLHSSTPALGPTQPPVRWVPGLFPWGKSAGECCWPPTPIWCEVHERVKLYLFSPSGPS